MNYTVIGDPVNLAARLEAMNKQFGTRVMVSEMTAEGLGQLHTASDKLIRYVSRLSTERRVPSLRMMRL